MTEEEGFIKELEIKGIIGFDGTTIKGFIVHPNNKHVIYSIGNKVIIQEWATKKQTFLTGHSNAISAVALSQSGKYIASGQINHIGFRAQMIVWSFEQQKYLQSHELHKVRVEAVEFSHDEKLCISLGGRDCEQVFVWDIEKGKVICSSYVTKGAQGEPFVVMPLTRRSACFITGGENHLAIWRIDKEAKSLASFDVITNKMRRSYLCIDVDLRDEFCYCGTTTGDIVKVRLNFHHDPEIEIPIKSPKLIGCFARISNKKLPRGLVDLYENGVRVIKRLAIGQLLVGAGDGTLDLVEEAPPKKPKDLEHIKIPSMPALHVIKTTKVNACITSIQLMYKTTLLVGTVASEIYQIDMGTFEAKLVVTCHTSAIYSVAFPNNFSDVFATASKDDVRVWNISTMQELLRIVVQNFSCSEVTFSYDGKCIITGWNDGIIRGFTPLTGRLMYSIFNAHNKGVSALAITSHGKLLVTGGCEGQVRLWDISPYEQKLICTLKEHKGPVSAININKDDDEAVSASTDGTCILWDLVNKVRRQIMFANTLFMAVKYYPTSVQILTAGSDRKVCYWEILDGSLVREIEGSTSGAINSIDISSCGEYFVSGGNDQIVKLWKYQEGITTRIGVGHSAVITACKFSPNGKYITTTSASGSIFVWYMPRLAQDPEEVKLEVAHAEQDEENVKDHVSSRSSSSSIKSKSERTDSCCFSTSSSCSKSSSASCQDSTCSSCRKPAKVLTYRSDCQDSKCSSYKKPGSNASCKDSKCSSCKFKSPSKGGSVKSQQSRCSKC